MSTRDPNRIYQPLPAAACIRVLSLDRLESPGLLVCSLECLDLRDADCYTGYSALSYEWGDVSIGGNLQINGQRLQVRQNLWRFFLQALRNGWTRQLWVDAICINQNDLPERNAQVALMGEIYSRAVNVLVWLGPLETNEIQAIDEMDRVFDRIQDYDKRGQWHNFRSGFSAEAQAGFRTLARKTYWKRKWIIQEIKLSGPNASLMFEARQIPLHRFSNFLFEAESCIKPQDNWYKSHVKELTNLLASRDVMTRKPTELGMLLTMFNHHLCSDPRDHIYALLSMSTVQGFPIDYGVQVGDLYWAALSQIFNDGFFDCARDLSGMAGSLRSIMQLSQGEMLRSLEKSVRQGRLSEMLAYPFKEAVRICLGDLAMIHPSKGQSLQMRRGKLPGIQLDYTNVATGVPRSTGKDAIHEPMMKLLQQVQANQPSILSLQSFIPSKYTLDIGDYYIGVVEDNPCPLGPEWQAEWQSCNELPLSRFLVDDDSVHSLSTSSILKFNQNSPTNQVSLAGSNTFDSASLVPLKAGDRICSFSDNQAALAIRRISSHEAICGTAAVQRNPLRWREKTKLHFKGIGSMGNRGVEHQSLGQDGIGQTALCSIQLLMAPHSILNISNWSDEVGRPARPFREHCTCKPGEGGCR